MVYIMDCKVIASPSLLIIKTLNIAIMHKITQLSPLSNKPLQMCFYLTSCKNLYDFLFIEFSSIVSRKLERTLKKATNQRKQGV